jgi:hypothetical protein
MALLARLIMASKTRCFAPSTFALKIAGWSASAGEFGPKPVHASALALRRVVRLTADCSSRLRSLSFV